jgi:hypothetical protein
MADFKEDGGLAAADAPSKASPAAVATALAGVLLAAYVLAWIYGPVVYYVPYIAVNVLAAVGLGAATGAVATALMRATKINGGAAGALIGATAGIASAWFSWATYIWALVDRDWEFYWTVLFSPKDLLEVIEFLAHNPYWGISKSGSVGWAWFYYAVWLCEFAILFSYPWLKCRQFAANNLLCRRCSAWLRETGDLAAFAAPGDEGEFTLLREALKNGDASGLAHLCRREPGDAGGKDPDAWLEAKGFACPNCEDEDGYARAFLVQLKPNRKTKNLVRSEQPLSGFIGIGVDLEERIFAAPPGSPEEPPAVTEPGSGSGELVKGRL